MSWWRNRSEPREDERWLAGRLMDEALYVFGAMRMAVDEPGLEDAVRDLLRRTALDVLDDVAWLAHLAASAPTSVQQAPWEPLTAGRSDEPPVMGAVQALGDYAERLAAVALVFASREDDASVAFIEPAAAAEARIELLAS
jgi:hypothetical protein